MESLRKLETTVALWYKNAPHLPRSGQQWLATNAWWLVLIGVILGAVGVFSIISGVLLAGAVLTGVGGAVGAALGGIALLAVLVALVFAIADVVLGAVAIMPLKSMQRRGWTLLFVIVLVNVLSIVVTFLFNFSLFGLVWGLLCVAVGAYFLFEIRDFYEAEKPARKRVAKKA